MPDLVWRWELTPLELWRGFTFWVPPPVPVRGEVSSLGVERKPLPGSSDLTFELAVSARSCSLDMQAVCIGQPELPRSRDRRSGILVFDGDQIVASQIIEGNRVHQSYRVVVHEDYRRGGAKREKCPGGLGTAAILEWFKQVKRKRVIAPQKMNPWGMRTYLKAQYSLYDWAIETGKLVPSEVRQEVESRRQHRYLSDLLSQVSKPGDVVRV